jgi:hypothetical protein
MCESIIMAKFMVMPLYKYISKKTKELILDESKSIKTGTHSRNFIENDPKYFIFNIILVLSSHIKFIINITDVKIFLKFLSSMHKNNFTH